MGNSIKRTSQAKTAGQAVYENLRGSILDGTLEPGSKLGQDRIASQLGVSRMPVREALSRLEAEGMIVFETYRGAFVAPLTLAEVEQIYLMRLALEPLLARLGAQQLQDEQMGQLESANHGLARALRAGDAASMFEHVRSFHEVLYAAAGRRLVLSQVLSLRDLAERYIRSYLTLPGRLEHVVDNHQELLQAARNHEAGQVEQLIQEELKVTRDALLASWTVSTNHGE